MLHQQQIVEISNLSAISESSVEIYWNIIGSRVYLEGVVIQYRQSDLRYDQFETITVHSDLGRNQVERSHRINNLSGGTDYDVFIQPFYAAVVGLPSSIKHIKTQTEQIVRKTEILVAEMINVTTLACM